MITRAGRTHSKFFISCLAAKLAASQGISTRPGAEILIATTETGKPTATPIQMINGEPPKEAAVKEEDDKIKKLQEEIRKKKDEEDKAKEIKPQDKSRPISSTPVPGTPWFVYKVLIKYVIAKILW